LRFSRSSPDGAVCRPRIPRGESLSQVAGQVYRDPTLWRVIARANDIRDPRRLEPGRVLTIPALP